MPEYVYVIGLVLGTIYVGCQILTTVAAYQTCKQTCGMLDRQVRAMEKEGLL